MKKVNKIVASALVGVMLFTAAACNTSGGSTTAGTTGSQEGTTAGTSTDESADPSETTANTGGETRDVSLTVWSPSEDQADDQGAWLNKEAESFQAANPDLNITFTFGEAGEGEARDKVLQDVEAAADVYLYANDQIAGLVAGNGLARLGGEAEEYVKSSNEEGIVNSVTIDDKVYGIPFTTNTWFMFYDKSVFSEEDIKSLDTMLEKGKVAFPLNNGWYIASFYLANGGTMFGEDGTDEAAGINFGGEKGVETTNYLVDLINNPNFVVDRDGVGISGLADGNINAVFSGSWDAAAIQGHLGENFGAAQLPTVNIGGSPKQLLSFGGTKAVGVNPNAEHMDVAVAFAQWLARPEAQQAHYDLRNVVPVHNDLLADDSMSDNLVVKAQNDTMANTSFYQPFVPAMNDYWTPAENFGNAIANGEVTHENAEQRTEEFNELLNSGAIN